MSDLTAFTFFKDDAGMFAGINPLTPIAGTGSLHLHRNGTLGRWINGIRATVPLGFTSGIMRWRMAFTAIEGDITTHGMAFQQSQANLAAQTGSAYAIVYRTAGTSTGNWAIAKLTLGLLAPTILVNGPTVPFNAGVANAITIEATWILDIANLGGMRVTVKRGILPDFSDLVLEPGLDIVITSNVLQTSAGEGPIYAAGGSSGRQTLFDSMSVIPVLVGG